MYIPGQINLSEWNGQVHFTALYPQPEAVQDYRTIRKLLRRLSRAKASRVCRSMRHSVASLFRRVYAKQEVKQELCYKLYGVDLLLDANYKPYLLEVNKSPDMFFYTENEDQELKSTVVKGVVTMMAATSDMLPTVAKQFGFEMV